METLSTTATIQVAKIRKKKRSASKPQSLAPSVQDYPFPVSLANPCIARYQNIYSDPQNNFLIIKNAYTFSMDFGSLNLTDWAEDIASKTDATQIQVRLGLYTGDIVGRYGAPQDRLTAFLYPVNSAGAIASYIIDSTYSPPSPPQTGAISPAAKVPPATAGDQASAFNFAGLEP